MGSGQLIRSLLAHGLVDEMFLMIHPIVLGSGRRLFGSSENPVPLTLIDSAATSTGVTMATYRP
jgi:dihydrofolate reductase